MASSAVFSEPPLYNYTLGSDDELVGTVVSAECLVGAVLVSLVVVGCFRIPSMRSPFGALTVNQCTSQLIACINSLVFFFFGFVLAARSVVEFSFVPGAVSLCLLGIIVVSYFLMSLNRLCAVLLPFHYRFLFGKKSLGVLVFLNWSIPLSVSAFLMIFKDCSFQFYRFGWTFSIAPNEKCGSSISYYILCQTPFTVLTILCDVATLIWLLIRRKRLFQSKSLKRREMNFARQVLVQGFVSLVHIFWYNHGRNLLPWFSEEWTIFLTTSFSSNLLHVFDAAVVFTCNLEFKDWLLKEKKKSTSVIVSAIQHIGSDH